MSRDGAEIEIEPGRSAGAYTIDEFSNEKIIIWPTELDEKTVVTNLIDAMIANRAQADWPQQIIANDRVLGVQQFMEAEEPYVQDNSGLVRFNGGPKRIGFSVTHVMEEGKAELQGVFGDDLDDLARKVIETTIINSGKSRAEEIIKLGQN